MKLHNDDPLKATPETGRSCEAMRYQMTEVHLFDTDAAEEKAPCGTDASSIEQRGVDYLLEGLLYGRSVGAVCERRKALAVRFVVKVGRDLEAEGLVDEAWDYYRPADWHGRQVWIAHMTRRSLHIHVCGLFAFQSLAIRSADL